MSQFNPTSRNIEPAHTPDHLAQAVLQNLSRPVGGGVTLSLLRSMLAAILTMGIWPLLTWPRKFKHYITGEQQQLWHFAEWLRLHSHHPAAKTLLDKAQCLRFRPTLYILSMVSVAWMAVMMVLAVITQLHGRVPFPWFTGLFGSTYGVMYVRDGLAGDFFSSGRWQLWLWWCLGLSIASFAHWLQVHMHAANARRFIEHFNTIAPFEKVIAIVPESMGSAGSVWWIIASTPLLVSGALWGLPLMLAGAAHQNYICHVSLKNRASLASRLRDMLLEQRPAIDVPEPMYLRPSCPRKLCRARVPRGAKFCPRCGQPMVGAARQQVA